MRFSRCRGKSRQDVQRTVDVAEGQLERSRVTRALQRGVCLFHPPQGSWICDSVFDVQVLRILSC
jgi:hypothetical protein